MPVLYSPGGNLLGEADAGERRAARAGPEKTECCRGSASNPELSQDRKGEVRYGHTAQYTATTGCEPVSG